MKKSKILSSVWIGIIVLIATFLQACGYHIRGFSSSDRERSIAVLPFRNETTEPNVEILITDALRKLFIKRGRFKLTSPSDADLIFRGRVLKIYTSDVAHLDVEKTTETRVYVVLDVRCENPKTGKVVWQDNQFRFYEEYKQGTYAFETFGARQAALEYLAEQVAERIYDRFTIHVF